MEGWAAWIVERMSTVPLVSAGWSIVVAYVLWAIADRWVLNRGRKGPVQWPILGATVEVLRHLDQFNDWAVSYFLRDGLTFGCKTANMNFIFTADPANVEYILKTNFANYPKGEMFHECFDIFLGDGIFNVDGEGWRKQRKTASFEFASRKLRDFSTAVFRDYTVKAGVILTDASKTQSSLDIQDLFMRFTLDSIFKIAFGHEIDTLKPGLPDVPFAKAFDFTNEVTTKRFMNPFWKLQRALKVGNEAALVTSAKVVNDFTYGVIEARKAELTASAENVGKEHPRTSGKSDLFTRFMLLNEEGEQQFTDKDFRDTLLNFILAGRDTTAATLSWFVYMTMMHPRVADKVYQELRTFDTELQAENIKGSRAEPETLSEEDAFNRRILEFSELLNYDSVLKLQYLHACILETLRLYPSVPVDGKCAAADDVLPDGTAVKKGDMIMYTAYGMGRMPSIWGPEATEFKPERWLVGGVVQPESPFKFPAFQAGPRICLGKDSAMLQLRVCLAVVCRFFKFQLEPDCVVTYRQMAILLMCNGLHVKMSRRSEKEV